jgi:hypothetical protein
VALMPARISYVGKRLGAGTRAGAHQVTIFLVHDRGTTR